MCGAVAGMAVRWQVRWQAWRATGTRRSRSTTRPCSCRTSRVGRTPLATAPATCCAACRFEDITPVEAVRANPRCDRDVSLYGYVRGCNWKEGARVHIAGVGDYSVSAECGANGRQGSRPPTRDGRGARRASSSVRRAAAAQHGILRRTLCLPPDFTPMHLHVLQCSAPMPQTPPSLSPLTLLLPSCPPPFPCQRRRARWPPCTTPAPCPTNKRSAASTSGSAWCMRP